MDPDVFRAWIRVGRDLLLYTVGTVIVSVNLFLYASEGRAPNYTWIAFAAFLYGLPPTFRADEWLLRKNGKNGNGNGSKDK